MSLTITWLGHAAFFIEGEGVRILLDPYRAPDAGSYEAIDVDADIVLVSHINDKYHSYWQGGRGKPIRLNGVDFADDPHGVTAHGVVFHAVGVWESEARTVSVSMPYFTLGGIRVCHMGDLGHMLAAREAASLADVDVLLAVAGGPPTVALTDLRASLDLIRPRLILPMHYQTGRSNLPLAPIDTLIGLMPPYPVLRQSSPTIIVQRESLPESPMLLVLPPAL